MWGANSWEAQIGPNARQRNYKVRLSDFQACWKRLTISLLSGPCTTPFVGYTGQGLELEKMTTHSGWSRKVSRGEEKQTLSILDIINIGQAFVMTMSSSLSQKGKGKSNKEFTSQNQANSPTLTHTRSHSLTASATDGDKAPVNRQNPQALPLPLQPPARMNGCHTQVGIGQSLLPLLLLCATHQNGTLLEMCSGYVIWGR